LTINFSFFNTIPQTISVYFSHAGSGSAESDLRIKLILKPFIYETTSTVFQAVQAKTQNDASRLGIYTLRTSLVSVTYSATSIESDESRMESWKYPGSYMWRNCMG
jgi:hypothetical protein